MIADLWDEDDDEDDDGTGVVEPSEETVWILKVVVCFCANEGDDALMSTCTFCAVFDVGVPEMVLVLSSYVSQLWPPTALKSTVT